eukprot:1196346-Prorocentrum_minimum.AAC.8
MPRVSGVYVACILASVIGTGGPAKGFAANFRIRNATIAYPIGPMIKNTQTLQSRRPTHRDESQCGWLRLESHEPGEAASRRRSRYNLNELQHHA